MNTYRVSSEVMDQIYLNGNAALDIKLSYEYPNSYIVLKGDVDEKKSCIAKITKKGLKLVKTKNLVVTGISPKDKSQTCFLDSLQAEDTQLIIGLGEAGTGKTTLALAYAFAQYQTNNKKIILVKSTAMVSNNHAFGPVPGDIGEKYAPYLTSFDIVIDKLLSGKNSKSYLAQMKERKDLEFIPVELVRGCTFEDCTVIVDEAQNLSWHEMKTLITRLGERSKMIILGDPNQIDVGVPYTNTGLHRLVNSNIFGESELTASIVLEVQYRSPIVSLIARIDKE